CQLLCRAHLLRVEVDPVALDRDHELRLLTWRRRAGDLNLRRHLDIEAHLQNRRGHHEDDEQHEDHVDQRRDVDLRADAAAASAEAHYERPFAICWPASWFSVRIATPANCASFAAFMTSRTFPKLMRLSAFSITAR